MRPKKNLRCWGFTYNGELSAHGNPMEDRLQYTTQACTYKEFESFVCHCIPIFKGKELVAFIWDHELAWDESINRDVKIFKPWKVGERRLNIYLQGACKAMSSNRKICDNLVEISEGHFSCIGYVFKGHENEVLNILKLMEQHQEFAGSDEVPRPIVELPKIAEEAKANAKKIRGKK